MQFQLPNLSNLPGLGDLAKNVPNLGDLTKNVADLGKNVPNPLPMLIDYRLTDSSLQIVAINGQFTLREFPYKEMIAVKRGYELWNEHWENRIDLWSSAVSIRLDRAVLPWVVITPEDPEGFVRDLSGRLGRAR